ncbi:hypothetical protein Hamer_G010245 [Homarus americanus]|uniref:F5/8 type C domain-containing protein n=1 Tax=Homarus americanus TaxID=6706 RepID=A0A8J5MY36_HOMAM|nr:hypothetical protein Hamer_G010245 [Homarus americanus]
MLLYSVWVMTLSMVLLLPLSSVDGGELHLWHQVLVSLAKVSSYKKVEKITLSTNSTVIWTCGNTCIKLGWCNLWYPDFSARTCTFYNTFVMPTYRETYNGDAILCYTKRPKDYATNANIIAGLQYAVASKTKENLVDGIYYFDIKTCFQSDSADEEKWFVLDLGAVVTFSHIMVVAQPNSNAYNNMYGLKLRVGTSPLESYTGFSAYDEFGEFPGRAYESQEILIQSPKAVSARFISGEVSPDSGTLQLCHVEVY